MFSYSTGLVISFGILAYGVAVYLLSAVTYIILTNTAEANIAYIENDETIFGWEDIQNAKAHIKALRHKLRAIQLSLVIQARNKGVPPLVAGILLIVWFSSKT
ncbi:MAG: hypothetical protein WBL19_02485 [Minisyncoccia bacterium]